MIEKVEQVVYLDAHEIESLVLYPLIEHLMYEPSIDSMDFTTIGLRTETPAYGRKGVKASADYTLNGVLAVRKTFEYVSNGLWIMFEWMDVDGDVCVRKTEFKPLSIIELANISKGNRSRTITYLQTSAIGTPIEAYVNALLKHYKTEVDLFIYNDTEDFINAINAEPQYMKNADGTDMLDEENNKIPNPYYLYLHIVIEAPSEDYPTGKTVKDSIIYQISK